MREMRACIPGMVLVVSAVVGGTPAFARVGDLVAISNNDVGLNDAPAGTGTVVRMDPTTGEVAAARVVDRSGVAMAWSHTDGTMYAVQHYDAGAQLLVTVDPATLAVTGSVGVLTDADDDSKTHKVTALGVSSDGELFGISARRTFIGGLPVPVGLLVSIDTSSGETSEIGSLGMPVFSRGGAVVDDEFILVSQRSRADREMVAWSVDIADASVVEIGETGISGDSVGVAVRGDGSVWAVISGPATLSAGDSLPRESCLFELDIVTGEVTEVGATGFDYLSGLAWMPDIIDSRHLTCEEDDDGTEVCDLDDILDDIDLDEPDAIAEVRIGGRGKSIFDSKTPRTNSAPSKTGSGSWTSGEEIAFSVTWDAATEDYTLVVDGNTLSTIPQDERDGQYLIIRVSSVDKGGARVVVDNLAVDGFAIDDAADSGGAWAVDRVDYLILTSDALPEGFTLTGTMAFSWSGDPTKPGSAHSKVEIAWGSVDD
jgi:hypothetical protein